jgi:hypothetical protein
MDTVVIQLQAARAWRKRLYRLASRSMDGGSGQKAQNYHGWITPKPNRTGPRLASLAGLGHNPSPAHHAGHTPAIGVMVMPGRAPPLTRTTLGPRIFLRGLLFREGRVRFKIRMRNAQTP